MDFLTHARYIEEKPRPKAGGRSFAFRKEIKLDREPKNILFVEALYDAYRTDVDLKLPFYEWRRHSFKDGEKFRTFMCARGNQGRDAECHACDLQFNRDDKRLNLRVARYWPVIHLEEYYINQYQERVQPKSRAEERDFEERGYEKVFGKLGFLELGVQHHGNLLDIFEMSSSMCVGCLEEHDKSGRLEVISYKCPHCGHLHDHAETTELNKEQWRTFGNAKHACPACSKTDFADKELACSQCESPERSSIFDLIFPLVKNGSGKDTSINLEFGNSPSFVDDFELPDGSPLMNGLKPDGSRDFSSLGDLYSKLDFSELFADQLDPGFAKSIIG